MKEEDLAKTAPSYNPNFDGKPLSFLIDQIIDYRHTNISSTNQGNGLLMLVCLSFNFTINIRTNFMLVDTTLLK